ncbi:MAG: tetratricopeptide repeat protein [Bacteroidales bacterium]
MTRPQDIDSKQLADRPNGEPSPMPAATHIPTAKHMSAKAPSPAATHMPATTHMPAATHMPAETRMPAAKKNHRLAMLAALLLLFSFALGACSTSRSQVAAPEPQQEEEPAEIKEIDRLRSTAVMIEAARQKMLGNLPEAISLYDQATQFDPGNDAAHYELAKIHAMQGQFDDALAYAHTAAELSPDNHHYQVALADIHILNNNVPEAILVYESLVTKHPENVDFAYNLASAYLYNDQRDEAMAMYNHIEELIGFSEDISIQKQKILVSQEKFDEAIAEAEKMISFFPEEPVYYELLGELYRETGQIEKARALYETMLEIDPGNPMAHLLMADYYQDRGERLKAFESLKIAFRSPELDAEGKSRIIYSFFMLSENDPVYLKQALELCDIMVEMHPDDPESYLIYGDFLNREERFEEARELFLTAARLDPSRVEVWQQILSIDTRLSDFDALLEHSELALEYFFEYPLLFLFNGLAHMQLNNFEDAASSFEYALVLAVSDDEIKEDLYALLGDTHHSLGNNEQSDEYYEKALELNPENATALNNYSYHLSVRKERLDEAEQMSKRAIELEADNPAFLDTHGWILYQKGRFEQAREWIWRSLQNAPQASPTVLEHYGDVLFQLGQHDEAVRYWEKALEAGEGTELLPKKVKDRTLYE